MAPTISEEAFFETPNTQTEAAHTQSKKKQKWNEELSDEAPRDVD